MDVKMSRKDLSFIRKILAIHTYTFEDSPTAVRICNKLCRLLDSEKKPRKK